MKYKKRVLIVLFFYYPKASHLVAQFFLPAFLVFALINSKIYCQVKSGEDVYEALRVGYFHATLTISKDSAYVYYEWNHMGQRIKDFGKVIYNQDSYFLNSTKKTRRVSAKGKSDKFYKFPMQKIELKDDKLTVLPCDIVFPEYCTFYKIRSKDNTLTNKKFIVIKYLIDGHGEWLDFINDSICIRSTGSVSWGTSQDTLNYIIKEDYVLFNNFNNKETGLIKDKKLKIEIISASDFKNDNAKYTRGTNYFYQRDTDSLKNIILLKITK